MVNHRVKPVGREEDLFWSTTPSLSPRPAPAVANCEKCDGDVVRVSDGTKKKINPKIVVSPLGKIDIRRLPVKTCTRTIRCAVVVARIMSIGREYEAMEKFTYTHTHTCALVCAPKRRRPFFFNEFTAPEKSPRSRDNILFRSDPK